MRLEHIPFRTMKPLLRMLQVTANMALVVSEQKRTPLAVRTIAAHDSAEVLFKTKATRPDLLAKIAYYWLLLDEWAMVMDDKSPDLAAQIRALRLQAAWVGRMIETVKQLQQTEVAS